MSTHRYYAYRVLWAGKWKKGRTRLPLELLEGRDEVEILWDDFEGVQITEGNAHTGVLLRGVDPPPDKIA